MTFEDNLPNKKRKQLSPKEAKLKAADYCAYQERSQQEVRDKLYTYGLHHDEVEEVISDLILEGFISESRFAKAYARGKFRMKRWGKVKIIQGLKAHRISENGIKEGLKEIDQQEYREALQVLLDKKASTIKSVNQFDKKNKLARYVIGKGFEPALVWETLKEF